MKIKIFHVLIPCGVAGVIAACSGSDQQDVIAAPDAAADQTTADTSTPETGGFDASTDNTVSDAARDNFVIDAGIPNVLDAGGIYEGGVPCVVGGLLETEPANDDANGADNMNAQNPTRCGATINGLGVDGGQDLDYMKFRLENSTQSFFVYFEGNVKLTVTVEMPDGGISTSVLTPTSSQPIPYVQNKFYTVKLEALNGGRENWRVTLFQN